MQKIAYLFVLLILALVACGRKADPQPAELVRPRPVTNLAAEIREEGVHLQWTRPDQYVNGKRIDDLGGFLVFRGVSGKPADEIATISVSDRERFQREKKFDYVDRKAEKESTYYYRIVSYTRDRYYSAPSNQAVVTTSK